jgi:hypothetical protein
LLSVARTRAGIAADSGIALKAMPVRHYDRFNAGIAVGIAVSSGLVR